MAIIVLITSIFLLFIQGGYYANTYIPAGILVCVAFFCIKKQIKFNYTHIIFCVLSIWYIISNIVNGLSYSSLTHSLLPFIMFLIYCALSSLEEEQKNKLIYYMSILGLISSVIGILVYINIWPMNGGMNVGRLQFTFQYANVAGIWFGVSFILSRDSKNKIIKLLSFLPLIALLFTKSVGAIGVLVILQTIWIIKKSKNKWFLLSYFGILFIGIVVLYQRFSQAIYTFVERFIQSYDGIRVIFDHVIFGIGPGNWSYVFPFYQSAQYKAGIIHNSYVQVGVDAGIVPMLILLIFAIIVIIKYLKYNTTVLEAMTLILLHSFIDFTLYYGFILLVLLLLWTSSEQLSEVECKQFEIKLSIRRISVSIAILLLVFVFQGYLSLTQHDGMDYNGSVVEIDPRFCGYLENEIYVNNLISSNKIEEAISYIRNQEKISYKTLEECVSLEYYLNDFDTNIWINDINKQKFNYSFVQMVNDYVKELNILSQEKEKFNICIDNINNQITKWPASMLNNQVKIEGEHKNE